MVLVGTSDLSFSAEDRVGSSHCAAAGKDVGSLADNLKESIQSLVESCKDIGKL